MTPILLAGDGSCDAVSRFGAWAGVVVTASERQLLYGVSFPSTISRCELLPVLSGLRWIRDLVGQTAQPRVVILSDSEYVVQGLGGLYAPKKNGELWAAVRHIADDMRLTPVWRSRNSHPVMELCDSVAHALRETVYTRGQGVHEGICRTAAEALQALADEDIEELTKE